MTVYLKKSVPLFFDEADEAELDNRMIQQGADTQWVDGSVWPTVAPLTCSRLSDCRSPIVYLWNRTLVPRLPYQKMPDGRVRGPTSGVVVQYMRSELRGSVLTSGQ